MDLLGRSSTHKTGGYEMKRTKRQLTIEVLSRLILNAEQQIEVLKGFDDPLRSEMQKVKMQLVYRMRKLKAKEIS